MIISPPMLRDKSNTESDSVWVDRMILVDARRGFPVNAWHTWHGGVHLTHSDSTNRPEKIRAVADGTVHFVRQPQFSKRDLPPYNYNGGTDCGCVVLKHETEIGSGENGKVTFFSLYMHLKTIDSTVSQGKTVYRKDPLGTVGQVDGANAIHFQIFCDDTNLMKLVGRTKSELDITQNGRTDVVYGDMHFYLPSGTAFYEKAPKRDPMITREKAQYTSVEPLFITMNFDKGQCTMTSRRQNRNGHYETVGEALVSENYEYDLYKEAVKLYPDSPSAGYEMLRFGRIINTEHETLSPVDAPHWREVNYPGGKGWVNLAVNEVKKFSDADFPHWMGWQLIDDDSDSNSQCHSPTLLAAFNTETEPRADLSYTICHFPFEWDGATVESRFNWLKLPNDALDEPMSEEDWNKFIAHVKALCIDMAGLPSGKVWHFEPRRFITHFRKCGWLGEGDLIRVIRKSIKNSKTHKEGEFLSKEDIITCISQSKNDKDNVIIRPENIKENLSIIIINYGFNLSRLRTAHFLSQIFCETGRFKEVVERGRDSYFDKYESQKNYAGKEMNDLAKTLGNKLKGDGKRFKGRGIIQTTGRKNYELYGKYKGDSEKFLIDAGAATLASNAYYACDTGGFYWIQKQRMKKHNGKRVPWGSLSLHYWADQGALYDDVKAVTKCVNGGDHGLDDVRWPCFEHALYALNDSIVKPNNFRPIE
ncbi:M23 family metallopeptidase [Photorhabdus sp. APURE]|uniref:peptidoglycan DD-metalloendopeptidase family protein n=1 Tax=Photorhabdus aballayi TaxID=2991723 RepID=UPI00223E5044|nr:peptidoglycan DD-metalloendopeptidase family protein [Photorhabdus aballayi]MCW7549295.1 M23 family metallopeptidase [Photorhabdus aballayi]